MQLVKPQTHTTTLFQGRNLRFHDQSSAFVHMLAPCGLSQWTISTPLWQTDAAMSRPLGKYLIIFAVMMASMMMVPAGAHAENGSGLGLGFNQMQKLWNGLIEKPRMTVCRLATRQTYKKKQICVYAGANRTYVAIYNDAGAFCVGEMQCKYRPDRSKKVSDYVVAFRKAQD